MVRIELLCNMLVNNKFISSRYRLNTRRLGERYREIWQGVHQLQVQVYASWWEVRAACRSTRVFQKSRSYFAICMSTTSSSAPYAGSILGG